MVVGLTTTYAISAYHHSNELTIRQKQFNILTHCFGQEASRLHAGLWVFQWERFATTDVVSSGFDQCKAYNIM
jgi:hypothetical protein